jgi:hypothetical protein
MRAERPVPGRVLLKPTSRTSLHGLCELMSGPPIFVSHHVRNVHLTSTRTIDCLLIRVAPIFFGLASHGGAAGLKFLVVECRQTTPTIRAARGSTLPTNLKSRILGIAPPHRSQSSRECRLNARTILGHPRLNSQARPEHGSVRRQHVVY